MLKFPPASPLQPLLERLISHANKKCSGSPMANSPSALARNDNSQGSSGSRDGGREERGTAWLQEAIKLSHRQPSPGSIPAPAAESQRRPSPTWLIPFLCALLPIPTPGSPGKAAPSPGCPLSPCLTAQRRREGRERKGNVPFLN